MENTETFYFILLPVVGLILGFIWGREWDWIVSGIRWTAQNRGEVIVRCALEQYCKNRNAHVLNCVTIQLEDGSTTQIDHILVCTKGIFVIETKHYTGWIFGDAKSKLWTQVNYFRKFTFQNPLRQNYKHVKEVQRIFDFIEPRMVHNIVVFSGDSEFKTDKIDNVCSVEELIAKIETYPDGALSLNRVQFCVGRLEYLRMELTQKTDIEHQEYLARRFGR